MTTQPAQPAQPDPARTVAIVDRISRLEGIAEQANERFNDQTQAINALRADNQAEHHSLRSAYDALRAENHTEHQALRVEIADLRSAMYRQTYVVIAALGGLVTLLRFIG